MNPQNNNLPGNGNGEQGNAMPNFDGFGGPNISYENYHEAPAPAPATPTQAPINVVNANGVISGRKMVDYLWQRIAYCALAFAGVLLIGLIVTVVLVGSANTARTKAETEKESVERNLRNLYAALGVSSQNEAIETLTKESELIDGGDLVKIDNLLINKFGAGYTVDFADSNLNFARVNNVFKVISVAIAQPSGTVRVILYGRIATGEWKLGGFDAKNTVDPCANSSDEEKEAIAGIFTCGEPIEEAEDDASAKSTDGGDNNANGSETSKTDDTNANNGDNEKTGE